MLQIKTKYFFSLNEEYTAKDQKKIKFNQNSS